MTWTAFAILAMFNIKNASFGYFVAYLQTFCIFFSGLKNAVAYQIDNYEVWVLETRPHSPVYSRNMLLRLIIWLKLSHAIR